MASAIQGNIRFPYSINLFKNVERRRAKKQQNKRIISSPILFSLAVILPHSLRACLTLKPVGRMTKKNLFNNDSPKTADKN